MASRAAVRRIGRTSSGLRCSPCVRSRVRGLVLDDSTFDRTGTARNDAAVGTRRGAVRPVARPDRLARRSRDVEAVSSTGAATQAVFGEGDSNARVVFVGEQPGDQEDRSGRPSSVPPDGSWTAHSRTPALPEARPMTNAVKHFKFRRAEGGKRRIHQSPSQTEIRACPPLAGGRVARARPRRARVPGSDCRQGGVRTVVFKVTEQRGIPLPSPPEWSRDGLGLSQRFIRPSASCAPGSRTTCMRDWSQTSGSSPQNWHDFVAHPVSGEYHRRAAVQRASIASMAAAVIRAR